MTKGIKPYAELLDDTGVVVLESSSIDRLMSVSQFCSATKLTPDQLQELVVASSLTPLQVKEEFWFTSEQVEWQRKEVR